MCLACVERDRERERERERGGGRNVLFIKLYRDISLRRTNIIRPDMILITRMYVRKQIHSFIHSFIIIHFLKRLLASGTKRRSSVLCVFLIN